MWKLRPERGKVRQQIGVRDVYRAPNWDSPGSWHLTPSPYEKSPLSLRGAKGHCPSIPQRRTEEQACLRYSRYIKQRWQRVAAQERACCLQKFWESPCSASRSSGERPPGEPIYPTFRQQKNKFGQFSLLRAGTLWVCKGNWLLARDG